MNKKRESADSLILMIFLFHSGQQVFCNLDIQFLIEGRGQAGIYQSLCITCIDNDTVVLNVSHGRIIGEGEQFEVLVHSNIQTVPHAVDVQLQARQHTHCIRNVVARRLDSNVSPVCTVQDTVDSVGLHDVTEQSIIVVCGIGGGIANQVNLVIYAILEFVYAGAQGDDSHSVEHLIEEHVVIRLLVLFCQVLTQPAQQQHFVTLRVGLVQVVRHRCTTVVDVVVVVTKLVNEGEHTGVRAGSEVQNVGVLCANPVSSRV